MKTNFFENYKTLKMAYIYIGSKACALNSYKAEINYPKEDGLFLLIFLWFFKRRRKYYEN